MSAASPVAQALNQQARAQATGSAQTALTRAFMDKYANDSQMLLNSQATREQQFSNRERERLTGSGQLLSFLQSILGGVLNG
jgi:hypothetical protein